MSFSRENYKTIGLIGANQLAEKILRTSLGYSNDIIVFDPSPTATSRLLQKVKADLSQSPSPFPMASYLRIIPTTSIDTLRPCDLIIESFRENDKLKQEIAINTLSKLDPSQVYAINSAISPISQLLGPDLPPNAFGFHLFDLTGGSGLAEIVLTSESNRSLLPPLLNLCEDLNAPPFLVRDKPAFFTTRLLSFYFAEALTILEEGISIFELDRLIEQEGFNKGPLKMMDDIGLDIVRNLLMQSQRIFNPRIPQTPIIDRMCDAGYLGRKNQKGFYLYPDAKPPTPNLNIQNLMDPRPLHHQPTDLFNRCLLLLINETIRCMDEEVIESPADGNLAAISGLGFPKSMGGPFAYVDQKGPQTILDSMEVFETRFGNRFTPAKTLTKNAQRGRLFFEYGQLYQ